MYGLLDAISSGPIDARVSQNSTMVCCDDMFTFDVVFFKLYGLN